MSTWWHDNGEAINTGSASRAIAHNEQSDGGVGRRDHAAIDTGPGPAAVAAIAGSWPVERKAIRHDDRRIGHERRIGKPAVVERHFDLAADDRGCDRDADEDHCDAARSHRAPSSMRSTSA